MDHTYANGIHSRSKKERPKTVELGTLGKISPKLPQTGEPKIAHAGPPKFRRKNSLENILADKSTKVPPVYGKKILEFKSHEENNNVDSDDDDGYEEVPEVTEVKPYAIHDVISPAERRLSSGQNGPDRPAPPPKTTMTMKPPVVPRVPRANSASTLGSAVTEQRRGVGSPTSIPKPVKMPPKVPQSPRHKKKNTEYKGKEVSGR